MANFHLTSIDPTSLQQFSGLARPNLPDRRQAGGMYDRMITAVRGKATAAQTEQGPLHLVPPAAGADHDAIGLQGDHHPPAASGPPEGDEPNPGHRSEEHTSE